MTDYEAKLRELGERVRQEQYQPLLRPGTLRAAGRRRVGTLATAVGVLAALAFGGTYAVGSLLDAGPDIAPAGPSQASFARLFSNFGEGERAIIEINADNGTVCADLSALKGQDSFTRVEIVTDPDRPQTFVPLIPSDNAFTPEGGGECVREVDHGMASEIIEHPEGYFLLVASPGDVRVSSLTPSLGDDNYATGPRIRIAGGEFQGEEWAYYGYESNDGLCLQLVIGGTSGGGCGFPERSDRRAITIRSVGTGSRVATVDGEVSAAVGRLDIQIGDGSPESVELHDPPTELGLDDRVFVYLIDIDRLAGSPKVRLLAYAPSGELLSKLHVKGFDDAADRRQAASQEGFAIWPEDTAQEANDVCNE
ncbi:MAG: hypothetical protein M3277_02210, partial [Actinomycetota bacterium]|nr:hypothetical protein [Actinomycetota bacterium]